MYKQIRGKINKISGVSSIPYMLHFKIIKFAIVMTAQTTRPYTLVRLGLRHMVRSGFGIGKNANHLIFWGKKYVEGVCSARQSKHGKAPLNLLFLITPLLSLLS